MKRYIILFLLCLQLTGCYHYVMRQACVNEEFKNLKNEINCRTEGELFWDFADSLSIEKKEKIDQMIANGISRNDAINIALLNNRKVQSFMVKLGLAKSEILEAQLFDNPQLFLWGPLFDPKRQCDSEDGKVEIGAIMAMNIANFWTIPYKTKVAKDALIVANYEIMNEIFETIKDTRKYYDTALWAQMRVNYMELIIEELEDLKKQAKKYWKADEVEDQKSIVDLTIANWQINVVEYKMQRVIANTELQKMLGLICFRDKLLNLTSDLRDAFVPIPKLHELEIKTLQCNPEIMKALANIKLAEDQISSQKAQVLNNFYLGGNLDVEASGIRRLGTYEELKVPLFNQNQGKIAQAYYNLEKAKRELIETEVKVKADLRIAYYNLIYNRRQLNMYLVKIEESYKKVHQHTLKIKTKALELIYIDLIRTTRLEYLDNYRQALDGLSELERVVGQRLDLQIYKDPEFAKKIRAGKTLLPKDILARPLRHKIIGHKD